MEPTWFPTCSSTHSLPHVSSWNSLVSLVAEPSSPRILSKEPPPDGDRKLLEGDCKLLASKDIVFAYLTLTKLEEWPGLDLRIQARDVPIQHEHVSELLDFIGHTLVSDDAANGFGITYDFRLLKNPSVSGLLAIAKWGSEPSRQRLFKERCVSCTACVPPGWKFAATKAAMSAFFMITPPTCRTYLTTDFDLANATVATFEPPELVSEAGDRASLGGGSDGAPSSPRAAGAKQRRRPSPCGGCFSWLRGSGDEALAEALERIERLEQANKELRGGLEQLSGRMAQLEAAVPWASTVAQLGLG